MMDQDDLLKVLQDRYSTNNTGDNISDTTASTLGVVVDTDDPLEQGRLRIFCPAYGDNPEKIHQLPWSVYISPYGGVINNSTFERNGQTTNGAVAYGMWAIPDIGADVLVGCIDGDLRRRYWLGCVPTHQQVHTLLTGRFEWSNGKVSGPLSSTGSPIQPAYDNLNAAFGNQNDSPEFQSRVADYTPSAVIKNPNDSGNVHTDQQEDEIADAQKFAFNKPIMGGHGYDHSGFSNIPIKASRVFGFSSPGFHSFLMDDRPFNNRSKWRSSSGHTILLDDTNDRIYITTNKGNSYVELDANGNIDIYSARRISLHSDSDINFDAKGSIRFKAEQGIYGYAGGDSGLDKLSSNPTAGEIRWQAQNDMHVISDNYRRLSFADTIYEIGGKRCESVGGDYFLQVENDMNTITNDGDYNMTISGDFNLNVLKQIKEFAIDGLALTTKGDVNMYAYYGNMNFAAQQNIVQKSVSGNISLQAVGGNSSGTGSVSIKAPTSQMSVSQTGTSISTSGSMSMQSGGDMNVQTNSPPSQEQPLPADQVPDTSCSISAPVSIVGYTGVDLAARVAYNAGFRGQSLVTAVAISGAESRFNPNATGDVTLETAKWGPSVGFWQIRTLKDTSTFHYPDTLRDVNALYDPQANANAAYVFSKQGKNFGPWSTYMNGAYLSASNIQPAIDAINRMCGNSVTPTPSLPTPTATAVFGIDHLTIESIDDAAIPLFGASPLKPSIQFTATGVVIQALDDITFVSLNNGLSINAFSSIKATSDLTVTTVNSIIATLDACCSSSLTPISQMTSTGVTLPVKQISPSYFPYVSADSESLMNLANFDVNGGTVIV